MKIAGIIYLHDISQSRMLGTTKKNLDIFQKLCGDDAIKNVILGTTKWSNVQKDVGHRREGALAHEHWKYMLDKGAEMARVANTRDSALTIVDLILQREKTNAILIQHELVDLEQLLPETSAGRILYYTLKELLQAQQNMKEQLEHRNKGVEDQGKLEMIEEQMRSTLERMGELKIPLSRRIRKLFTSR